MELIDRKHDVKNKTGVNTIHGWWCETEKRNSGPSQSRQKKQVITDWWMHPYQNKKDKKIKGPETELKNC